MISQTQLKKNKIPMLLNIAGIIILISSFSYSHIKTKHTVNDSSYLVKNFQDTTKFLNRNLPLKLTSTDYYYMLNDLGNVKYGLLSLIPDNNKKEALLNMDKKEAVINGETSDLFNQEYNKFMNTLTTPITEDEITSYQKLLKDSQFMFSKIETQDLDAQFIQIFQNRINELSSILSNKQNIQIINEYRKNLVKEDFQTLVRRQETKKVWDIYFKDKYGVEIQPIAHMLDGTDKGN